MIKPTPPLSEYEQLLIVAALTQVMQCLTPMPATAPNHSEHLKTLALQANFLNDNKILLPLLIIKLTKQ